MGMTECLVIGGGLAGSMAALRLASAGRSVVLIEKERAAHDKVCGEFLSAEAISYLSSASIDPVRLGAVPVHKLRLSAGKSVVEATLPFPALSLSRRVLDEAMLLRAEQAGADVRRGSSVDALVREAGIWAATLSNGSSLRAQDAFLATGKHDLRGWQRSSYKSLQDNLVGFKLHWRLEPRATDDLRDCMELFLFRGGYGGLALVEEETANLCLVVKQSTYRKQDGWPALLHAICAGNRLLTEQLAHAEPLWARPLAVSSIPYGYLAEPNVQLWRLGDQAAVIPSFTGDGMSIALHSGAFAAEMYLAGARPNEYQKELSESLRKGIGLAMRLSRAAVHPVAQLLGPAVLRVFPGIMQWVAESTRIPRTELLAE